jgi:hypothetical protein
MLPRSSKYFSHAYEAGVKSVIEYHSYMHAMCTEQADEYARQIREGKITEEERAELQHKEQLWRNTANSYVNACAGRAFRARQKGRGGRAA